MVVRINTVTVGTMNEITTETKPLWQHRPKAEEFEASLRFMQSAGYPSVSMMVREAVLRLMNDENPEPLFSALHDAAMKQTEALDALFVLAGLTKATEVEGYDLMSEGSTVGLNEGP